jgi:hypothetical protein
MNTLSLTFADMDNRFAAEIWQENEGILIADIEKVASNKFVLSTSGVLAEVDAEEFLRLLQRAIERLRPTI